MSDSYIRQCLFSGRVARWPEQMMPIKVYIKSQEIWVTHRRNEKWGRWNRSATKRFDVLAVNAIETWGKALGGLASFEVVDDLQASQIDISFEWPSSLMAESRCENLIDKEGRIYSSEIYLAMSESSFTKFYDYNVYPYEAYYALLFEFGRALGLGVSPYKEDAMFSTKQEGNLGLSQRDINTMRLLYQFLPGEHYEECSEEEEQSDIDLAEGSDEDNFDSVDSSDDLILDLKLKNQEHLELLEAQGRKHLASLNPTKPSLFKSSSKGSSKSEKPLLKELSRNSLDINLDGKVDAQDFYLFASSMKNNALYQALSSEQKSLLDLNQDALLGIKDVALFTEQFLELLISEKEKLKNKNSEDAFLLFSNLATKINRFRSSFGLPPLELIDN